MWNRVLTPGEWGAGWPSPPGRRADAANSIMFETPCRREGSRGLNADSTRELLARLQAEGLIRGNAELDMTPEGETLYRSLREYIAGPTAELLGQFDFADVETTVRTLQAIAERAAQELPVAV
jgi:hypothetical protein